ALGVGSAAFGYGEDNDYAIRAWSVAKRPFIAPGLRVLHAETRETSGRNRKGYITVCALNLTRISSWLLLVKGVVAALVQDVLTHSLQSTRNVFAALDTRKLYLARRARRAAKLPLQADTS